MVSGWAMVLKTPAEGWAMVVNKARRGWAMVVNKTHRGVGHDREQPARQGGP